MLQIPVTNINELESFDNKNVYTYYGFMFAHMHELKASHNYIHSITKL